MKAYVKMQKKTIKKLGDIEIQKLKNHYHKGDVDINKIVVSNKVCFGKKRFKDFIGYKETKRIDLYVYFSQKWLQVEKALIKLNIYRF